MEKKEKKSIISMTQQRNIAIILVALFSIFGLDIDQQELGTTISVIIQIVQYVLLTFGGVSFGVRGSKGDLRLGVFRKKS